MALNEAFYSTSGKIEGTIQDQIDEGILEIKHITKQSLGQLRVDILNSNSHLNIRDENLKDKGDIRDNESLTFLGGRKMDGGKLFLEVRTSEGLEGYVSADYVIGKVKREKTKVGKTSVTPPESADTQSINLPSRLSNVTSNTEQGTDKKTITNDIQVVTLPSVEKSEVNSRIEATNITAFLKNKVKPDTKSDIIESKETTDTISTFFGIGKSKIEGIKLKIEENNLNLDIVQFLATYKKYIETNLAGLDENILNKIKLSISRKFNEFSSIINERVEWVDNQIKEGDYKKEDRIKEIQNQRWIINSNLNDLFSEITNKVLPSAMVLAGKIDTSSIDSDMKPEIKNMFNAELLDDGEFDKDWSHFEIWDSNTNNWSVLDSSDEDYEQFLKDNNIASIDEVSLLNEEDREIESNATIAYTAYVIISMIPYIGAPTAVTSDITDVFSDEEGVSKVLRTMGIIDENYRMEKTMVDNILGGVGLALTAFGLQGIVRGKKIVKASSKLNKVGAGRIENVMIKMGEKMKISKNNIDKAIGLIKKDKLKGKVDTPKTADISKFKEGKPIITEAKKIEKIRTDNGGKLTGDYVEYNARYQDLYKKLDNDGITDPIVRGKEVKKLDRQIAIEIKNEPISRAEYLNFRDKGIVEESTLDRIATKISKNEPLSKKENAIFTNKTNEVNKKIVQLKNNDNKIVNIKGPVKGKIRAIDGKDVGGEIIESLNSKLTSKVSLELRKLKKGEKLEIGNIVVTKENKAIGGINMPGTKGTYKVQIGKNEYQVNNINEVNKLVLKQQQKISEKLVSIQKLEVEKQTKRLKKLSDKGADIEGGFKFGKNGKFLDGGGKVIEFEDLPTPQKIKALESLFDVKGLGVFVDDIVKSMKSLGIKGVDNVDIKAKTYDGFWSWIKGHSQKLGNENIKKVVSEHPVFAGTEKWSSIDRSIFNITEIPEKILNTGYIASRFVARLLVDYGPARSLHNFGTSKKWETLKVVLTGEKDPNKWYILGVLAASGIITSTEINDEDITKIDLDNIGDISGAFISNVFFASHLKLLAAPFTVNDFDGSISNQSQNTEETPQNPQ